MDLLKGEEEEELRVGFRSSEVQEAWCCSQESHGEKMGRHQRGHGVGRGGSDGGKTKGRRSEQGGRWEGVAPGWDGREAGRPQSQAQQ